MFRVGEYIVYGMNGVCEVEAIGAMDICGVDSEKMYYTLNPLYSKRSRVFTPVDNSKIVMRAILSKEEVCSLIDESKQIELIDVESDKNRELAYKESLKTCDCREWFRIIETVRKRKEERMAQGKRMSACDERYLKQAQDNLYGEFAVSLGIQKSEVESYVEHRLRMKKMASAS